MRYIKDSSLDRYEDILDFANMVFSMEYTGIDFSVYLPKAYGKAGKNTVTHHMFMEDDSDRIRAIIDTYPITLKTDEMMVKADYVGTVAVHPGYRGMGLFSHLMEHIYSDAISKNTDLLILDGDRFRYGNFNYEKAGIKYCFTIEYRDLINNGMDKPRFSFEEIEEDSTLPDKVYELYRKRNITARGREDLYVSLIGMKASLFAVMEDGDVVGYVSLSEDEKSIYEFELEALDDISRFVFELMEGFGISKITAGVGSDELGKIIRLEKISSSYNISCSHQIRIINYEKVVAFLLNWKQKYERLTDGEYFFGIKTEENVNTYEIKVIDSKISVTKSNVTSDNIFTERDFVKYITTGYYYINPAKTAKEPAGWFPLPFFLPEADTF